MIRFTTRDLLWLMVVVAMGVAWQMDVRRCAIEREKEAECVNEQLMVYERAASAAGYGFRDDGTGTKMLPHWKAQSLEDSK